MKRTSILMVAVAVAAALAGCARYFSAEVAGFVKDSGTGIGVTGATIRIYTSEPSAPGADGFIAETASGYSGQIPGWFDRKIMWESAAPAFKEEGDTLPVWISAEHPDFSSRVVKVSGIISDAQNIVPDIELARVVFSAMTVTGTVTIGGIGMSDVRVVIDLTPDDGVNDDDYITITTTSTATTPPTLGSYTFLNVKWRDENPDSPGADTTAIAIRVTYSTFPEKTKTVAITSGQLPVVIEPISLP